MEENKNLKEAVEKLDRISEDEKMQRIIELREKARRDEHAIYSKGVDDGIEKGIKEGIEQGVEQGKIERAKEEKIQIAKNMLQRGFSKQEIMDITGLTSKEIEELISNQ